MFARLEGWTSSRREELPQAEVGDLPREIERVEAALGRLTALYAEGEVSETEYRRARSVEREKLDVLNTRLDAVVSSVRDNAVQDAIERMAADVGRLRRAWDHLTVEERRQLLTVLVARVSVSPGRGSERMRVEWHS